MTTSGGVDVASFHGDIDFAALKADGNQFVFLKVTEGTGFVDPKFAANQAAARAAGLRVGYYHFVHPDLGLDPHDEAAFFLSHIGTLQPGELTADDFEVPPGNDPVGWNKTFLDDVRAGSGSIPFLYLNQAELKAYDWTPVASAGYPLWLADYDGDPLLIPDWIKVAWPGPIAIKQYSDVGTAAGIAHDVDLDDAEMDLAQFGKGGDMLTQEQFDAMFLATYMKIGAPALFDAMKKIEGNLSDRIVALEAHATATGATIDPALATALVAHQQAQDAALAGLAQAVAAVNNQVIATRDALHKA